MAKYFVTRVNVDIYTKDRPYKLRAPRPLFEIDAEVSGGKVFADVDEEGFTSMSKADWIDNMYEAGADRDEVNTLLESEKRSGVNINEKRLPRPSGAVWHGYPVSRYQKQSLSKPENIIDIPENWGLSEDDEEDKYINHYRCPYDGTEWDDSSSSTNNDRCPECDAEIEPHTSEDI